MLAEADDEWDHFPIRRSPNDACPRPRKEGRPSAVAASSLHGHGDSGRGRDGRDEHQDATGGPPGGIPRLRYQRQPSLLPQEGYRRYHQHAGWLLHLCTYSAFSAGPTHHPSLHGGCDAGHLEQASRPALLPLGHHGAGTYAAHALLGCTLCPRRGRRIEPARRDRRHPSLACSPLLVPTLATAQERTLATAQEGIALPSSTNAAAQEGERDDLQHPLLVQVEPRHALGGVLDDVWLSRHALFNLNHWVRGRHGSRSFHPSHQGELDPTVRIQVSQDLPSHRERPESP